MSAEHNEHAKHFVQHQTFLYELVNPGWPIKEEPPNNQDCGNEVYIPHAACVDVVCSPPMPES